MSNVPPWLQKDPWTGIGKESVWGFSPALDLLDVASTDSLQNAEEIQILLTGASDCRHLLKTLAKSRRHTTKPIKFILHEPNLRTHARHLMFLQFLMELDIEDDLDEKTFQLLELLGNCKLRADTQTWLRSAAQKIAKFLSDGEGLLAKCVDTTPMKARERDWIEEQVQWWKSDKVSFDIDTAWDQRMRLDLAERYDARKNMIDWDYHMGLGDLGPLVKFQEYRYFRNTAIAYDKDLIDPAKDGKAVYEHVNRSLLHFDRKGKAYYAGDIKNGPFACFGVETPNRKIIIKQHDGYRFGAGVCALHNVRAWLYEWLTGREWVWQEHVFQWDKTEEKMAEIRAKNKAANPMTAAPPLAFTAQLCTLELETMVRRWVREEARVHVAYVGVMAGTYVQPWLLQRVHDRGQLVMETAKFVLELNDEQRDAYVAKLREKAEEGGWVPDAFGQKVTHLAQLQEKQEAGQKKEQFEGRRKRMTHPNCLVYSRPAATKTDAELKQFEADVAEKKRREEEEAEKERKERAAAFEQSEKERLARDAERRKKEEAEAEAEAAAEAAATAGSGEGGGGGQASATAADAPLDEID